MAAPFPRGRPQVEQSFFPLTDLEDKHGCKNTATNAKMKPNIYIDLSTGTAWEEGALEEFT